MRRLLITALLLLVLSLQTVGAAEVLSNQTYSSLAAIDLPSGTYTVHVGAVNITTMQLTNGNESHIMSEGDCKRFYSEVLCYEEKTSDTAVRLVRLDYRANIDVDANYNETGPFTVGDTLALMIWVNNTGERPAEDVNLTLNLPENVSFDDIDDCTVRNGDLTWRGTLDEHDEHRCDATLRINGPADAELQAVVNYTTFNETRSAEAEPYDLKADMAFAYTLDVPDLQALEPATPFPLRFSINNTQEDENLTITRLTITHGRHGEVVGANIPGFRKDSDEVTLNDRTLEPDEAINATVRLAIPYIDDEGTITWEFTYNTTNDGTARTIRKEFPYRTTSKELIISTEPEKTTFESFTNGTIDVIVTNPYRYLTFKGYDAEATLTLDNRPVTASAPYERERKLLSVPYEIPDVTTQREERLKVTVNAKTEENQAVTKTATFDIRLLPLQDVEVTKDLRDDEQGDGTVTVTVNAKNRHQQPVKVKFKEELPAGVFARGDTEKTIEIGAGETKEAYAYDLLFPAGSEEDATVTTAYEYTYLGNFLERTAEKTVPHDSLTTSSQTTSDPVLNNTNATDATPATRSEPRLLHIIVGAAVLLVLVLIGLFWDWLRHVHAFKIRHGAILKQYQQLVDESKQARERRERLAKERSQLKERLHSLESHVEGYEHHLPDALHNLQAQEQTVQAYEDDVKERHDELKRRLKELQDKEAEVKQKEERCEEQLQKIHGKEDKLAGDDTLLNHDVKALYDEQERLTKDMGEAKRHQEDLAKRIKSFKGKHESNLHSKLDILSKEKQQALRHHRMLGEEEDKLKQEFQKLQYDLASSEADLDKAEKLYKQVADSHNKGDHGTGEQNEDS
ncbi:hypothetical protein KY327_00100 [Candidatus Woesearchaeota archaeon]|nr:hypothetical protein [Candidatus Woesearchaeota archaeon]